MFDEELAGTLQFERPSLRSEFKAMQILNATGAAFHVDPQGLRSGLRGHDAEQARQAATYLIREDIGASLPWIGRFVGQHHSTVIHGLRKVKEALAHGGALAEKIRLVRAMYPNMPADHLLSIKRPTVSFSTIIETVAAILMVNQEDIYSERHLRSVVFPRQVAVYLLREIGGWSIADIALHFDQENTTVRYSYRKIKKAILDDPSIRYVVREVRAQCLRINKAS